MAVNSKHPHWGEYIEDWVKLRDAHAGSRKVKSEGTKYLPPTTSMRIDGMSANQPGKEAYDSYRQRAIFPEFISDAVEAMIGVMHHKSPTIELPPQMEPLRDKATNLGESLEMLLRRINEQQLITGRLGLMADVADGAPPGTLPYIAIYFGERIINWDNGRVENPVLQNLNLVVIDESEHERGNAADGFEWRYEQKFRVMVLGDLINNEGVGEGATYTTGLYRGDAGSFAFNEAQQIAPSIAGRKPDEIPFTFINSKDIVPSPDKPPLMSLCELAFAVYCGEADYRQALFMQGQDTLVVIGSTKDEDEELRTGAGARIDLPAAPGADAKYIGVSSEGLSEMRTALENDKAQASTKSSAIVDNRSAQIESGDALKTRVAAKTATLTQVALAGAFGLENSLKQIARWIGADETQVSVKPNLDFDAAVLQGKTLVEWMQAKVLGAPISLKTIHDQMAKHELTDLEYEEELDEIEKEGDGLAAPPTTEEDGPVEDGDEEDETDDETGEAEPGATEGT